MLQDLGVKPKAAVVDLGYRGVDADVAPLELIRRGNYKSLNARQRRWLKRRQAIEPTIGTPSTTTGGNTFSSAGNFMLAFLG